MGLTEKISYIRGLAEGMKLNRDEDEAKVFNAIMELLEDMAFSVEGLEEYADEVGDLLDVMDEDLGEVEDILFDEANGQCDVCDYSQELSSEEDDALYEIVCPTCGETICLEEDMLQENPMSCPSCGQSLELDLSGLQEQKTEDNKID